MTEPKPQWTYTESKLNQYRYNVVDPLGQLFFVELSENVAEIICAEFNRLSSLESENRELREERLKFHEQIKTLQDVIRQDTEYIKSLQDHMVLKMKPKT